MNNRYGRNVNSEKVQDMAFDLSGHLVRTESQFSIGDAKAYAARILPTKPVNNVCFPASLFARLPNGSQVIFSLVFAALGSIGSAWAQIPAPPTLDPAKEAAAIKAASELDDNPADALAVQQVCTACHSSSQFLSTPRSSSRWEQLFGQMAQLGANPNDEQVDQIIRYFQRNLMVVNVNTSPAEELGPTLQSGAEATTAIVMRRAQRKFTGIDDLAAIPGIDRNVLVGLKGRLQF